jgi:hypothetical protein
MANQYWFKPKIFGYGASPTTWEGWAVVVAYCAVVSLATLAVLIASWFVVVGAATAVLAVVSKRRTDGEWRWRWGRRANISFRERWKI